MIAFIAIVLALLVVLLSAPVKAVIRYSEKEFYVDFYAFGLKVFAKAKEKQKDYKASDAAEFEKDTVSFTEKLKAFKNRYSKITSLLKKHSTIEIIKINISVGTGDAATTAISTGALWGTVYALVAMIGKIIFIDEHSVSVVPDYVNAVFKIDAECIIKSHLVYIIIIACKFFYINPKKGKEE